MQDFECPLNSAAPNFRSHANALDPTEGSRFYWRVPRFTDQRKPTLKERLEDNILWVVLGACVGTAIVTATVTWTIAGLLMQRPSGIDKTPVLALETPSSGVSPLPSVPSPQPSQTSDSLPKSTASAVTPSTVPHNVSSPKITSAESKSLEQMQSEYQALSGHFAEREAYIRRADGKHVRWRVQVVAVWTNPPTYVMMQFQVPNPSIGGITSIARFDLKEKERIYALQTKDLVEIDGTLKAESDNLSMLLIADDFRLVAPAEIKKE